ncbi:MAG: hypothetical protein KAX45_08705 [Chitinophagaceae bacterium]|nr:hypothetical protein [Chitinophagaceae bacterium]MBP8244605.1 hypothetical protein [Chitinophagaceae bacterium]
MSTLTPSNHPFASRQFLNTGKGGEDIAVMIETVLESVAVEIPTQNENRRDNSNSFSTESQLLPLALKPMPLPLPDHLLSELLSITS